MIGIIDYGVGNLRSVQKALQFVGAQAGILQRPEELEQVSHLVLPGVGAFADGMRMLGERGFIEPLKRYIEKGNYLLGICLGMQLLFAGSEEDAQGPGQLVPGLAILPGQVVRFRVDQGPGEHLKVPHMGWNELTWQRNDPLLAGLPQGASVYFVHSFYAQPLESADRPITSSRADYGSPFCASIWRDNIWATQFHPEKSQRVGLQMLANFAALGQGRPRQVYVAGQRGNPSAGDGANEAEGAGPAATACAAGTAPGAAHLAALPLLRDPGSYRPCLWDLTAGGERTDYWLGLFRKQFVSLAGETLSAVEETRGDVAQARAAISAAQNRFYAYLDQLQENPGRFGPLDIITLCRRREEALRQAGIDDPYRLAKARENSAALAALPALLTELDALPRRQRWQRIIEGVFAGNIFDLGAPETLALFLTGRVDFHATRQQLKPRPWLVDDLDPLLQRLDRQQPYRSALLMVDNAGSDIVLGMIPLARELARQGARVLLGANSIPTLNDVTAVELSHLLLQTAGRDPLLTEQIAQGSLAVMASGNGVPLIDLGQLDPAFCTEVARREIDLLVLEGMGRAIESNYHVPFRCDCIKLAMLKDRCVAQSLDGELYDLVLRFEPA